MLEEDADHPQESAARIPAAAMLRTITYFRARLTVPSWRQLAFSEHPGQEGVRRDAGGLRDDTDRNQHGSPGVEQLGLGAVSDEIAEDAS